MVQKLYVNYTKGWALKDNILFSYLNDELLFGLNKTKLSSLVKNYQNPIYVYDLAMISRQVSNYKKNLPVNTKIFYAVKANANREILVHLKSLDVNVDVVSVGEIKCALDAGFRPDQIMFSGVGKTALEIEYAIQREIFQINVESLSELKRVIQISSDLKKNIDIAVRINPDISVETHPYISTGLKENKFGLEINQLDEFATLVQSQKNVFWRGLSVHLGSQIFDIEPLRMGIKTLIEKMDFFRVQFPDLNRLDLGGGLGIDYHSFDFAKELKLLSDYGQMIKSELGSKNYDFLIEPGRSIVGHAGLLITQIQYIKKTTQKTFVIVDSGMNHLLRPSLYQAEHRILVLEKRGSNSFVCDVVGPICESSDFFARNYDLPQCQEGDFLVICDAGAYGYSMASRYNQTELPIEVCI
jgi:diaminopimelate decarboxylase